MRFLRSLCFMGNFSCVSSSLTSSLWLSDLRVFITRTMAASICAQENRKPQSRLPVHCKCSEASLAS